MSAALSFSFGDFGPYEPGQRDLVATGVGQSDAAPILKAINHFGTVPGGAGAQLPQVQASTATDIMIINRGQNQLNVYPPANGRIEQMPVNAAFPVPSGTAAVFVSFSSIFQPALLWSVVVLTVLSGTTTPPASIGATPPSSPIPGQLWWDSTGGQLYIYFDDGSSQQWVVAINETVQPVLPEAPTDGQIYGRGGTTPAWTPVLPSVGGQLTGPLLQPRNLSVATTAGSLTIPNNCTWQQFTQTATIASFVATLPPSPVDGQDMIIASRGTITAFTLAPSVGQTIDAAPATLTANIAVWFRWIASLSTWVRLS